MNEQQALEILVKGVQLAQQKGVYTLQDAALIAQAVSVFVKPQETENVEGEGTQDTAGSENNEVEAGEVVAE